MFVFLRVAFSSFRLSLNHVCFTHVNSSGVGSNSKVGLGCGQNLEDGLTVGGLGPPV